MKLGVAISMVLSCVACTVTDPVLRQAIAEAAHDPDRGRVKLKPFAERGDPTAIAAICVAYGRSLDSEVRQAERLQAFAWCRQAAQNGDETSQFHLGNFYAWGIGVDKDRSEALHWYREAASHGHVAADDAARALEGKPAICRNPITGCRLM